MRFKTSEEWAVGLADGKAPFGQFPTLEVDGRMVAQTGAVARFCGKMAGFYPRDDDFAAAKVDEILDTATDMTEAIARTMGMKDVGEKMEARRILAEETLPKYLTALERIVKENGSTGYYVGTRMTIADLALWRLFGWLSAGREVGLFGRLGPPLFYIIQVLLMAFQPAFWNPTTGSSLTTRP